MTVHQASTLAPVITEAPVLQTERLILRGHRAGDLDAVHSLWSDPIVVKYTIGRPSTREESWWRILRYAGLWRLLGFGYWAVEERRSGRFVGDVGFADFKRALEPPFGDMPEAGWVLDPAAHGKGYATEAVGAVIGWSDAHLPAPATACMISPENLASLRVAEKCGYREYARSTYSGEEVVLLRRDNAGRRPPPDSAPLA